MDNVNRIKPCYVVYTLNPEEDYEMYIEAVYEDEEEAYKELQRLSDVYGPENDAKTLVQTCVYMVKK